MSDVKPLEDEVRRALRATAEAIVVDDRPFDPAGVTVVGLDDVVLGRRSRRTQWTVVAAAAAIVLVVAGAMVVRSSVSTSGIKVGEAPATTTTLAGTTTTTLPPFISGRRPAPPALVARVASIPVDALDAVGVGTSSPLPTVLPGPALTEGGKPRVVWVGAEYCPYCAAQRWPLIVALSRFGTFSDLGVTSSAITAPLDTPEVFPNTQTFSFHGSTYSSPYIVFDAVETETNAFQPLDTPTAEQQALVDQFDAAPYVKSGNTGAIPFVDFANSFLADGSTFDPGVLQGKNADEIVGALLDPATGVAKAIDGSANAITATICRLTNDRPASVCSDPVMTAIGNQLPVK